MLNIIVPIKEVISRKIYIGDSVNFAEARATKPNEAIANPKRLKVSLLKSSNIVNSSQNCQDWQILISVGSSKNYTTKTNENGISTHEEIFNFTRASLRSVEKHTLTGKMLLLRKPTSCRTHFCPNSPSANFCKLHIMCPFAFGSQINKFTPSEKI